MKVFDIVVKDMLRSLRSAMGWVFMFAVPLLVTGMFYFMFGNMGAEGGFEMPRTRLVVANLDTDAPRLGSGSGRVSGGFQARTLSGLIVEVLQSDDLADLLEVTLAPDAASARAQVDTQQAQVAVIIPAGFSKQFSDPYDESVIEFYQDPTQTVGPVIVHTILNRFMDSIAGVKIAVNVTLDEVELQDPALIGQVIQNYMNTSVTQDRDVAAAMLEVRSPVRAPVPEDENPVAVMLGAIMGGMMIFYAFYTGTTTAQSILQEEKERTLPRLFTTPTPQATILTGKFLAVFVTVSIQVIVLLLAARFIFAIEWGDLPAVGLTAAGIILSASTFGIFVNSLLKDSKQGGLIYGGVLTVSGMLGMIRIFAMNSPAGEQLGNSVSLLVPQGWAIRGLLDTMNGRPLQEVLISVLVMLAWSAAFFAAGVFNFNRRYA